ncbi:MAG: hypothetical protein Q8Q39_05390 [bacterium]|nr:hypothetical protein [bacterium]
MKSQITNHKSQINFNSHNSYNRGGSVLNFGIGILGLFGIWYLVIGFFYAPSVHAAKLTFASDLLSTSQPSASSATTTGANHTITFVTAGAIPASGYIVITPETGYFAIPSGFDFADADIAVASTLSGPYTDRTLAATPSAGNDGIGIITGTSGAITVTLNSTDGISASSVVRIELGTHATAGATGDTQIANPTVLGTRRISVETRNAASAVIDSSSDFFVAIVQAVTLGPIDTTDFDPPVRSNGLPSGSSIPAGVEQVEISLETDEWATCRYSTTSGTPFAEMVNSFEVSGQAFHSTVVGDLVPATTFNYNVRCQDFRGNSNPDDYLIFFIIEPVKASPGPGFGRGGGSGEGTIGSNFPLTGQPFPPLQPLPVITIEGIAYPQSIITILRDGQPAGELTAGANGRFTADFFNIPQGIYTFSLWALDTDKRQSITFASTFSTIAGTKTLVTNLIMPPTIAIGNAFLGEGEALEVFGQASPGSIVEVRISPRIAGAIVPEDILNHQVTAGQDGKWRAEIQTDSLFLDTYEVRARALLPDPGWSIFSTTMIISAGGALSACQRADINRDGRVGFVDFSILLFEWGRSGSPADINLDDRVNLVDFSIMLTCWTG